MLSPKALEDLDASGLTPSDIAARPLTTAEVAAVGRNMGSVVPDGYVIPYFNIQGESQPYYRVKFLGVQEKGPKYMGPKGENNHVYFPPGLPKLLDSNPNYIIITEGEKKAACAVKCGFPCVALGGVYNWKVRSITFPEGSELTPLPNRGLIKARLPAGETHDLVQSDTGVSAAGFDELMALVMARNMTVIIIYDTDESGVKLEVQKAAAQLGYEIRYRGLPIKNIRQVVLPVLRRGEKIGLDNFLVRRDSDALAALIRIVRGKRMAFPQHPNTRGFLSAKLQKGRMSRKEVQDASLAVLMELEARGKRLRNTDTKDDFYFDESTHRLMHVILNSPKVLLHETDFGSFLYKEYNIAAADQKLIGWLAAQFTGEPGMETAATHKVLTRHPEFPNQIAYQLSDTHYILIKANPNAPYEICVNGQHGILFESGQVDAVDPRELKKQIDATIDTPPKMVWKDVIDKFNFTVDTESPISKWSANSEQSKLLAALLFYTSPWLLRWKGTQLPVELVVGEAGSGKSSLYGLRQQIITGHSRLSNRTRDIRDWFAGITGRGGLYVMDNVKFTTADKDYQQQLSDEICRIVTEPDPRVEMRKLYTTSDVVSMPISCTFAITSVSQPFYNIDILQRAAIFELESIASTGHHDAHWPEKQLEILGGRVGWLAHHIVVLHHFLRNAVTMNLWDPNFHAGHRLSNYEQVLMIMARVFDIDFDWIPSALKLRTTHSVTETDWTLSMLKAFADHWKEKFPSEYEHKTFGVSEIAKWASTQDQFMKNNTCTNSWSLSRYIKGRYHMINEAVGMFEQGKYANRVMYALRRLDGE